MQETENALVRQEPAIPDTVPGSLLLTYDAEVRNRFEFDVREGVKTFDTAHVFEPLPDERYMQWIREFKLKGHEDHLDEESREATCRLWDEQIFEVENIDVDEGADFRALVPMPEKLEAITAFLSVAIGADIIHETGRRRLSGAATVAVATETFFNGEITTQFHELKAINVEWQKKYSRIRSKQFKQEKIGGLRRQPKIEYVPQDHKLGELYDEMFVGQKGFANGRIPLRFKTTVIEHLFGERLSQKKSES